MNCECHGGGGVGGGRADSEGFTGRSPESRRFHWAKRGVASVLLSEALNRVGFAHPSRCRMAEGFVLF